MNSAKKSFTAIFFITAILAVPMVAFAASEHEHHASIADLVPYWKHFIAFIIILYLLVRKPVGAQLVARRENIAASVRAGQGRLEQAEHMLTMAQKRFAQLSADIEILKKEIANDTEREAKLLLEDAIARAARIKSNAEASALAEQKAAQLHIRNEVAERAISLARERLKSRLTVDSDRATRAGALSGLGGLAN